MEVKFEELGESMMIVHLKGRIDLETIEPFVGWLNHLRNHEVIFNMRELSFVGSNGITTFIESMRNLARGSSKSIKFCYVSSEFRRIFGATLAQEIEIHEDLYRAQQAFRNPTPAVGVTPGGMQPYFQAAVEPLNLAAPAAVTGEPPMANNQGAVAGGVAVVSVSAASGFIENPD